MNFVNHTPFPAQDFGGIDQHDQEFHVIALRQTLTWDEGATLVYADAQLPLCEEDVFVGAPNVSAVLQESDYCQYKPRCDVIVHGTAHAPRGQALRRFTVRLVVRRPDTQAPAPPQPEGLNQFMAPSPEAMAQWRRECAQRALLPGQRLIDKRLIVTGERQFLRRWPRRLVAAALKIATLGIVRIPVWRLGRPARAISVPLHKGLAFGGTCRIDENEPAARRVGRKQRLTAEQMAALPEEEEARPVALAAWEHNPGGVGFAPRWFVKARRLSSWPAPQIEAADMHVTARHFDLAMRGKLAPEMADALSAGFGVRPKCHPRRQALAGTVDDAFAASDAWLPQDFDFFIWNAAEPDQQVPHLQGDELIDLTNLCPHDADGAQVDADGNTVLSLALPANACHALVRLQSGEMFVQPMLIDTLIVEPDLRRVSLVWRLVLARDAALPIRAVEARMHSFAERDRLRAEVDAIKAEMAAAEQARLAAEQARLVARRDDEAAYA